MSNLFPIHLSGDRSLLVISDVKDIRVVSEVSLSKPMPDIRRGRLRDHAARLVTMACGGEGCDPVVVFTNEPGSSDPSQDVLSGGTVNCRTLNCPLSPGEGLDGDREPCAGLPSDSSGKMAVPSDTIKE